MLPVGSAHVERCFSLLKQILGDWRLSLGTETISKLMNVCSDAPPPHEYDSQLAVTHWLISSARRHHTNHMAPKLKET